MQGYCRVIVLPLLVEEIRFAGPDFATASMMAAKIAKGDYAGLSQEEVTSFLETNCVEVGKTMQLKYTVLPANAADKRVKFTSLNPEVATIDEHGIITAVGEGVAEIQVQALDASGTVNSTPMLGATGAQIEVVTKMAAGASNSSVVVIDIIMIVQRVIYFILKLITKTETWTRRVELENKKNVMSVQGFTAGTRYCYSFEIRGDGTSGTHKLYCFDMDSSSSSGLKEMKPLNNKYPVLGHANDMALANINGETCMFVVVCSIDEEDEKKKVKNAIVKLQYDNTNATYWEVERYPVSAAYGGIANMSNNGSSVEFLLKRGDSFDTVSIGYNQKSDEALVITPQFSIDRGDYVNYTSQGVHYCDEKVYVPLWGYRERNGVVESDLPNQNVILVYNHGDAEHSKSITIKKGNVVTLKFEIEGCAFPKGRSIEKENDVLWFNTNEAKTVTSSRENGGIYPDNQAIK